jgi:hypothetical protein
LENVEKTAVVVTGANFPWQIQLSIAISAGFTVGALALSAASYFPPLRAEIAIIPAWLAWWHLIILAVLAYAAPFVAVALGWRPVPTTK